MNTKLLLTAICLALLCAVYPGAAQEKEKNPCGPDKEAEKAKELTPEQVAELLAEHRKQLLNAVALTFVETRDLYFQASEHKEVEGFLALRDDWSNQLAAKAETNATPDELAETALLLDNDGYTDLAKPLLELACKALKSAGKVTREVVIEEGSTVRTVVMPNPKFVDVVTRLGWTVFTRGPELEECTLYAVEGSQKFEAAWNRVDEDWRKLGLYPAETAKNLEALSAPALESLRLLKEQDVKDGFAIKACQAWLRFENAQKTGKVDRSKGKRSFSPRAMGRDAESFRDVWMYFYVKPFVVYLEKPSGAELSAGKVGGTLNLLGQLHEWFRVNLIEPFELTRVKPLDNAELAEREGWPLEVIIFADQTSIDTYMEDAFGQATPGARSLYAPIEERLIVCLTGADDAEALDLQRMPLAHETFHYLSDLYAVGPQITMDEMYTRPRYSSVLVQEGLADMVAGLKQEGSGSDAKYSFAELNTLRLKDFKAVYEILGNKLLFRLRDLAECRSYGQCIEKAVAQKEAEKLKVNPMWVQQVATSAYYATACQAAYFFHHFTKEGKYVYRDKWWAFLKDEYQGKHILKSYDDNAGVDALKEAFEIKADADWDTIEAEFLEFTLALKGQEEK